MPKSQFVPFLNERVSTDGDPQKLSPTEVEANGGPTKGYIGEMLAGKKDPLVMGVDTLLKFSKGLREDPVILFKAIIGKLERNFREPSLGHILEEYDDLTQKEQEQLRFIVNHLQQAILALKAKSNRHS